MTEVAASGQHRYSQSIGNMLTTPNMAASATQIEMCPNPEFSFPRLPPTGQHSEGTGSRRAGGRPLSMMADARPLTSEARHKRAATQQLPSFSFNSSDHTGLSGEQPSLPPLEPIATTPSSRHRRNVSEFVGGVGMNSAISSSPTRTSALEMPKNPRGHRHRRSAAISSHDLSNMLAPAEPQPRLSSSLPSTPLEHPMDMSHAFGENRTLDSDDPFGPALDTVTSGRPPSRRQVGFSDNVEYIPRPLSTISSETESSLNTIRGHSVNNSISSVLSLSTPSPPASRSRAISLETTMEDEPRSLPKSSIEISKRMEREGEWLKHGSSRANVDRPATASDAIPKTLTFAADGAFGKSRPRSGKKHTASRSLGFDRRKSEPAIGVHLGEPSRLSARLSALSLQEPSCESNMAVEEDEAAATRRSSTRKIKDWAVSKIVRRARPRSEVFAPRPPMHPEPFVESSVAETNLDAVFNMDIDEDVVRERTVIPQSQLDMHIPTYIRNRDSEDGAMLDLDDALGRSRTPTQNVSHRPRKMLHSDRGTQDFMGPGAHYQPMHNRTASAPVLMAFDMNRTGTPPQQGLAVFDEEEEDQPQDIRARPTSTQSTGDEENLTGVSIVDQAPSVPSADNETSLDEGLGIGRSEWDLEAPQYPSTSSRLSTPILERRASSIVDQTIVEETSPIDLVTIVNDQGIWQENDVDIRAHSLTKSSDSSEAPTIMAVPTGLLALPDGETPETFQSSAFSSPDFARRQSSFDTSRVGTSASSMTDNRTVSSCTTGEPQHDHRMSVDDVPSLTSSRSTMISTMHANTSRRDVGGYRTPSMTSGSLQSEGAETTRRKRRSIQSMSQLVGMPFGPKASTTDVSRPSTAATETILSQTPKKKEHRLKKLMFWKSKHRQASSSTII